LSADFQSVNSISGSSFDNAVHEKLLCLKNISKDFFGNKVLNNINLEIKKGEIHALVGENGAGKSTLMNILFGMPVIHTTGGYQGSIEIDGKEVQINTPHAAMAHGIGMVHQEFMLIPGFTITENIKINREITNPNIFSKVFGRKYEYLDYKKMNADARAALDKLDMGIEEYTLVAGLPVGHMQFIEIAREIDKTAFAGCYKTSCGSRYRYNIYQPPAWRGYANIRQDNHFKGWGTCCHKRYKGHKHP